MLFHLHQAPSWQLGIWQMDESPKALRSMCGELYDEAVERFASVQRRKEWLSVRLLLRAMLQRDETICYEPSGKPYLASRSSFISISHTQGYAALILGTAPVGIDIEHYGERVRRVASRFMRPDEVAAPYRGDETWGLLLHWSAKEVMFKCLDTEEVDFRQHLRLFPFVPEAYGSFEACEYRTEQRRFFHIDYLIHDDFVLTWHCGV